MFQIAYLNPAVEIVSTRKYRENKVLPACLKNCTSDNIDKSISLNPELPVSVGTAPGQHHWSTCNPEWGRNFLHGLFFPAHLFCKLSSTVYGSLMSTCILGKTTKQMVKYQWRLGQGHALLTVYKHYITTSLKRKPSPTFSKNPQIQMYMTPWLLISMIPS